MTIGGRGFSSGSAVYPAYRESLPSRRVGHLISRFTRDGGGHLYRVRTGKATLGRRVRGSGPILTRLRSITRRGVGGLGSILSGLSRCRGRLSTVPGIISVSSASRCGGLSTRVSRGRTRLRGSVGVSSVHIRLGLKRGRVHEGLSRYRDRVSGSSASTSRRHLRRLHSHEVSVRRGGSSTRGVLCLLNRLRGTGGRGLSTRVGGRFRAIR